MTNFRTLVVAESNLSAFIKSLESQGAVARSSGSIYVLWSGQIAKSIITVYKSGKVVFDLKDSAGEKLFQELGGVQTAPSALQVPARPYAIGLDETGTGELFGRIILGGTLASKADLQQWGSWLQKVNTKQSGRSSIEYWSKRELELAGLMSAASGVQFKAYALSNKLFTAPKMKNKLMDQYYVAEIITPLLEQLREKKIQLTEVELTLDDYRPGPVLRQILDKLAREGMQVTIKTKADDTHAVVRLAAIWARIQRSRELQKINAAKYAITGILPGNGNVNEPRTKEWARAWKLSGKPWPWFVKQWFKTVNEV